MKYIKLAYLKFFLVIYSILLSYPFLNAMNFSRENPSIYQSLKNGLNEDEIEKLEANLKSQAFKEYSLFYPLHVVIKKGNFEEIQKIIKEFEAAHEDIDEEDNDGKTPLYLASYYKNIKAIKLLIKSGANPRNVLEHQDHNFLNKKIYQLVNNILQKRTEINTNHKQKLNKNNLKKTNGAIVINFNNKFKLKEDIGEILQKHAGSCEEEKVYIVEGLICRMINNYNINELKPLLLSDIKYVDLSMKSGSLLLYAIKFATKDNYQIVELLLSRMDLQNINAECLIKCYLAAKEKR